MTEKPKKTPERNVWGLFGKIVSFVGGLVVGSLIIGEIGGKKH